MDRTAIVLTSGGSVIVKGDFDLVAARLRGCRGGLVQFVRLERDGHSTTYIESPVLVNVEQVTCVRQVS